MFAIAAFEIGEAAEIMIDGSFSLASTGSVSTREELEKDLTGLSPSG
jgi:hypothetical protein